MSEPWVAETVRCPGCGAPAEREYGDGCTFFECSDGECGRVFGHQLDQAEDACQLGVPAAIQERPPGQVFLGSIGRRSAS